MSILACLYGTGVGLALSMTGGGGVIAVPALVLGLGYSFREAAPVAMIAVGAGASLGLVDGLRRGLVRFRAGGLMGAAGMICAPLGLRLAERVSTTLLTGLFSAALLYTVARMARQALAAPQTHRAEARPRCGLDPQTGRFVWTPRCVFTFSAIGGLSGLASGMLGVGGGFVVTPSLRQVSELGVHSAVATSLMVIVMVSASAVAGYLGSGGAVAPSAWTFVAAVAVGMIGGRSIAARLPGAVLQLIFAAVGAAAAIALVGKTVAALLASG
ncbi:sulfite exporter TauE/SafE family protein [Methylocella sp.]|uniref:sulfite exporter TauE/SafE family protein n=1 Tax=Methylocella sp. TaxID=1978226 RepID=UPI003783D886